MTKRYGSITAVNNISFAANRGEIFGFLGPNGAGKTMTIRLLTGQTRPTSGEVVVCDYNICIEPVKAKERAGVVPEV